MNAALLVVGLVIGFGYLMVGDATVALLIGVIALDLPFQGRSAMYVAEFIKARRQGQLIVAQVIATLVRVSVGICVAALVGSSLALGLAMLANSIVMVAVGYLLGVKRGEGGGEAFSEAGPSLRFRAQLALHQVSQVLPSQVDYMVVAAAASPALLGAYFVSYQATGAISGVLAGPLSKATMSELQRVPPAERSGATFRVVLIVTSGMGLVAAALGVVVSQGMWLLPAKWADVGMPLTVLLASLPARFMTPLSEALNMVRSRWRRSTGINVIDTAGTALASLVALSGNIVYLAIAITVWKLVFGMARVLVALEGLRRPALGGIVLPALLGVLGTVFSVLRFGELHWGIALGIGIIHLCQLTLVLVAGRERRLLSDKTAEHSGQ
ncbi:hypothetical protein GCM10022275_16360 [Tessaracoccus defluvii]